MRPSGLLFLAALLPGAARLPAEGPDSVTWLAGQPPETLAGKLQPAEPTAAEGVAIHRTVAQLHVPAGGGDARGGPVAIVEVSAQRSGRSDLPGQLTAAQWAFRVASEQDAGYTQLQPREEMWYGSTYWQGGEPWLRVGKDWQHPGDRSPSVRRFAVPADGSVTVTGRVCKAHRAGDGVGAAIMHNGRRVWHMELAGDDGQGVDPNLSLAVRRGDTIRFVVEKRKSISCDTTHWDPVITYADGRSFRASVAFAERKQGAGGWYYETPSNGGSGSGMPRLLWFSAAWAWRETALVPGRSVVLQGSSAQPCAALADGQDASGIVLAWESAMPWQLKAELGPSGMLTVRWMVVPGAEEVAAISAGRTLRLGRAACGPYSGRALAGLQALAQWVASERPELPVAGLREAALRDGIPEIDYWAMIQEDWQRQDGTDPQRPETYAAATARQLEKARFLLARLKAAHGSPRLPALAERLEQLAQQAASARADGATLYLQTRLVKREIALANPLLDFGPLVFCKRVPTSYSHLVMQYYGWRARPGGGLFVLERPGRSLRCRDILNGKLDAGNVLEPRLSYDARRVVFSYVHCPDGPLQPDRVSNDDPPGCHYYHIYEVGVDGTGLRQLTNGSFDDLMPCYLPDGGVAFTSTRRKGYARCFGPQFSPRWDVYTLHRMNGDGSDIRAISFHDTNEWFPAVAHNGELLYARWDYIDRDAVTHQNLWATRPDGTCARALWGNATAAPHCTFQLQPIPDSSKIMFAASAHHSIAGGSLAMVDPSVAADGEAPLERITPEIPFPEAESRDVQEYYEAPWPLSEDFYLVGYSPHPLVWEPGANPPHALGLYLLDRWGNRELLYRDVRIGSTNPCPLRARQIPPRLPETAAGGEATHGEMLVSDVYQGLGIVPQGTIKELRIVQIFPKTTPITNLPPIGMAGEENGRAVLGTVPVEADGSARFLVPAGKPLLFQLLDDEGCAYQTMRSVTYVQPGEKVSCVGCHEPRMAAPPPRAAPPAALRRPASNIQQGPWDGRPFSYVEVVQPVLDRHCVRCHGSEKTEGQIRLTREPRGAFNCSYVALMQDERAFWGAGTNPENAARFLVPRFGGRNQIQVTAPGGLYGARGSRLMKLLREEHAGVKLGADDLRRLAMWMDLNAIFYGVNLPADQRRMLRGETVGMPPIQ